MKRRDDPNQTLIEWGNPQVPAHAVEAISPDPVGPITAAPPRLIQQLPWDFDTTFPQPSDEAIEAGKISDEDNQPENIKAIHDEHARHMTALLNDFDAVMDARRRGIDPATGKPPRTHATREKLRQRLAHEPARIEREYGNMLGVYEEVFGIDAADAFDKALRAWHAGIPVKLQASAAHVTETPTEAASVAVRDGHVKKHLSSVLPVPRPLAASIAAGHFGYRDDGKPVRPCPDEVRAITENHAERMIELLDRQSAIAHLRTLEGFRQKDLLDGEYNSKLAMYAEDFGEPATVRLDSYVRHQAQKDHSQRR